ncbi:hypothetical protein Clacol_001765 [Clathrus columnatus]|uniref:TLC domain-containing protein n=1 Tax=Clathrus columnatus TaxID=1419009 RepID=A0AAV5A248_9AGAM|nr:hypothetical protein Clacol_001765 [Clathrus columnatus]
MPLNVGFWSDIKTMRWMRVPASSFKMIFYPSLLFFNFSLLQRLGIVPSDIPNPIRPLLLISHRIPSSPDSDPMYQKGYCDLLFVAFYVIVWSFVRQSLTFYVLHPIARYYGIKKQSKLDRFAEQGYALIYFLFMTVYGTAVMSTSKIWWYKTEHFWLDYPHWEMTPLAKSYYLLHSAYWTQQLLVLALRLEKPRKDFTELVIHHIVTLWLIGWSYLVNMTRIGNAVFLSMDVSDVFLALTKLANYLEFERTKTTVFLVFLVVWTYFRHYLNLKILWSVWFEFDLVPEFAKRWSPEDGVWFPYWMKYQIFSPLVLLQLVNLFWYFLIWRILIRALTSSKLDDVRSDDEDGEGGEEEIRSQTRYEDGNLPNGVSNRAGRIVVKTEDDD